MNKNKNQKIEKVVITEKTEAKRLLRTHLRGANKDSQNVVYIGKSRAKWASVRMIDAEMRTNANKTVDLGWLGRVLNSTEGVESTRVNLDGRQTTVYRVS